MCETRLDPLIAPGSKEVEGAISHARFDGHIIRWLPYIPLHPQALDYWMYFLSPKSLFPAACRVSRSLHYKCQVPRQITLSDSKEGHDSRKRIERTFHRTSSALGSRTGRFRVSYKSHRVVCNTEDSLQKEEYRRP